MTQAPRIHLNGTSGRELLAQYTTAMTAVNAAIEAVQAIECNGRDYYTISNEAAAVAVDEKRTRLIELKLIYSQLTEIALDVQMQMEARK
ncbi:hypothetical protein UFOVP1339_41 [uncultured Caudovirales phage]|uniref:Uncharacterized protein n=1 Tax=uncultured Caudovirales phage TaxID=2100421 RepID=A0A6J5RT70_9CAUD|nr:hypothetical protein UFOVP1339_41 [uncultured Caudovirales phage]